MSRAKRNAHAKLRVLGEHRGLSRFGHHRRHERRAVRLDVVDEARAGRGPGPRRKPTPRRHRRRLGGLPRSLVRPRRSASPTHRRRATRPPGSPRRAVRRSRSSARRRRTDAPRSSCPSGSSSPVEQHSTYHRMGLVGNPRGTAPRARCDDAGVAGRISVGIRTALRCTRRRRRSAATHGTRGRRSHPRAGARRPGPESWR